MLFNEIYGTYFRTVAAILNQAVNGKLTGKSLAETVQKTAFGESVLTIPKALRDSDWPLLQPDLSTPLQHPPVLPVTTLEKRWLKTLLQDPRIRLFDPPMAGLEDVEPLYDPDVFVFFDRYADGDPYDDPQYIQHFRDLLRAMEERRKVRVRFLSGKSQQKSYACIPYSLEYSAKDDKFRLLSAYRGKPLTVNVARITSVILLEEYAPEEYCPVSCLKESLTMLLTDERSALERVMLHFSDLEKETEQMEDGRYRVTLWYKQEDEAELLIRILSFGPVLQVTSPKTFVAKLRDRIKGQLALESTEQS